MNAVTTAETALKTSDPAAALIALQNAVRAAPGDAKLRVFLFQLLCIEGQWDRALNQLEVCAQMDSAALPMREVYSGALSCEALRGEVFAGRRAPMLFGEPEAWLALLIESLLRGGMGDTAAAAKLREQAFDAAPGSAGILDGKPFEWIADSDSRLGPVLEAIVNGRYYWVPFCRLSAVKFEAPEDLRDFVWAPVNLQFVNGGETLALIPVRYAGSERATDGATRLAHSTSWVEAADGSYAGLGQRVFTTDAGDFSLLECRELQFSAPPTT